MALPLLGIASAEPARDRVPQAIISAAPPDALGPYRLSLDLDTLWRRDAGYQLFSSTKHDPSAGLSLAHDVLSWGERGSLAVAIGWQNEGPSNSWGGTGWASLEVNSFYAAAIVRWSLLPWLEPELHVGAGASHGTAHVMVPGASATLEGDGWAGFVRAGGGLCFRTGSTQLRALHWLPSLAFSAAVSGGLQVGSPLGLAVHVPAPTDKKIADDRIAATDTKLGDLGRTHPYARVSFTVLF